MNKKFELTSETLECYNHTLHRIVALKDFANVKKGDRGGWVEDEENLSQKGDCWIYANAKVYEDAKVFDNAQVYEDVEVYGDAVIWGNAKVYGNANIGGTAQIGEEAQVYGNANVGGHASVHKNSQIYGEAQVYDYANVGGEAQISGKVVVRGNAILRSGLTETNNDFVVIGPQGSRYSFATYHIPSDTVCTGCFSGTLAEFTEAVEDTHKNNADYLQQYKKVITIFNMFR